MPVDLTDLHIVGEGALMHWLSTPPCSARPIQVLSVFHIEDSLNEGTSLFMAELMRVKSIIDEADVARAFGGAAGPLKRVTAAVAVREQSLASYVYRRPAGSWKRAFEEGWSTALVRMQADGAPGDRLVELAVERQLARAGPGPPARAGSRKETIVLLSPGGALPDC